MRPQFDSKRDRKRWEQRQRNPQAIERRKAGRAARKRQAAAHEAHVRRFKVHPYGFKLVRALLEAA